MIDLIKYTKSGLKNYEVIQLVAKNNLSNNSEAGKECYSNKRTKNFKQEHGIYIAIDVKRNLKLECSLQKYFNECTTGERQNYNFFTMKQAKEAHHNLISEKTLNLAGMKIKYYEVGLNLLLSKDCINYLRKITHIETKTGKRKKFYINPKFKNERTITTEFHDDIRVNYRVYDKVAEIKDKNKKGKNLNAFLLDKNILRIETVNKRVEKQPAHNFFFPANLKRICEAFFRDWEGVVFEPNIIYPPHTGKAKKEIASNILAYGKDNVLKRSKEAHKCGKLTDREYRSTREFVKNEWNTFETKLLFMQSAEEQEFRSELGRCKAVLFNEFINLILK